MIDKKQSKFGLMLALILCGGLVCTGFAKPGATPEELPQKTEIQTHICNVLTC